MTTYTFENVISIKVVEPPLDAEVLFVFPDSYPGGQAAAEAYARSVLAGNAAELEAMTAERDQALAGLAAMTQKRDNIVTAYNAADADTDRAIAENT